MSALPSPEAQQTQELTEEFIEEVGRKFLSILPASMSAAQRQAAIESTAAMIRDVDALILRVNLVDGNTQTTAEADLVRNRLKGLRAIAWIAMKELNPDQAWFWTEEWQAGERAADRQAAAGEGTRYHSDQEFLTALEARMQHADA